MAKNADGLNQLTCGEISSLWIGYQYETIHKCALTFFIRHAEDKAIQQILEDAYALSIKRIERSKEIFNSYNQLVPQGFSDSDVNLDAPRLFSDELYLHYILQTIQLESTQYDLAFKQSINQEVIAYFHTVLEDTLRFTIRVKELATEKGIYIPSPTIPKQTQIEFVKKDSFLAGWIGERRPLLGIEIAELVVHAKRNALGQAVITAFSQVAQSKEIRSFFEKGREIAGKHLQILTKVLHEEYLSNASLLLVSEVTNSTEAPFSDKLMTVFMTNLISVSIGGYGLAMAMSPRRDLGVMYTRLVGEVLKYSNEGTELLIKNGWMEQPPMAADRKDLAK